MTKGAEIMKKQREWRWSCQMQSVEAGEVGKVEGGGSAVVFSEVKIQQGRGRGESLLRKMSLEALSALL